MAAKRKMKKNHQSLRCPYCGAPMTLRPASFVYARGEEGKKLLVCNNYPRCDTYVGTHSGTGQPLGIPANGDLRNLRIRTHRVFDRIWENGIMTRDQAYRWFADSFSLRLKDAHIGMCSEYQCRELIRKCEDVLTRNRHRIAGSGRPADECRC